MTSRSVQRGEEEMTANELTRLVVEYLTIRGAFAWRNNTGSVFAAGRRIKFGYPGSGDILGLTRDGRFLSIEIKVGKDVESEDQIMFREMVRDKGGLAFVVREFKDIEGAI